MLRRSFSEFHSQRSAGTAPADLAASEATLAALPALDCIFGEPAIEEFHDGAVAVAEMSERLARLLPGSRAALQALVAGRLVLIANSVCGVGVDVAGADLCQSSLCLLTYPLIFNLYVSLFYPYLCHSSLSLSLSHTHSLTHLLTISLAQEYRFRPAVLVRDTAATTPLSRLSTPASAAAAASGGVGGGGGVGDGGQTRVFGVFVGAAGGASAAVVDVGLQHIV
jgi:hypothetical protein